MTDILAMLLVHPLELTRLEQMLLLLPLCLSIAIVYKTTKLSDLRQLPRAALVSWITIVVGMYAVGVCLLIIYEIAT